MRKFEKISFEQFKKDITDCSLEKYNTYDIPKRQTKASAGYDLESRITKELLPGESYSFPTGIKCSLNSNEVILLIIRSSLGFKHNLRLVNQIGVIDADYYNNVKNEGHIFIKIQNEGNESFIINEDDRIAQCVIVNYLTVDDETPIDNVRNGGMGSTN